jgi:hypothetical protein
VLVVYIYESISVLTAIIIEKKDKKKERNIMKEKKNAHQMHSHPEKLGSLRT